MIPPPQSRYSISGSSSYNVTIQRSPRRSANLESNLGLPIPSRIRYPLYNPEPSCFEPPCFYHLNPFTLSGSVFPSQR